MSSSPARSSNGHSPEEYQNGNTVPGGRKKLDLHSLSEGVATLICPSNSFMIDVLRRVYACYHHQIPEMCLHMNNVRIDDDGYRMFDEDEFTQLLNTASETLGVEYPIIVERLGEEFFCLCFEKYGRDLGTIGGTLFDFYSNLDGLKQYVTECGSIRQEKLSYFRCSRQTDSLQLYFYSDSKLLRDSMVGHLRMISVLLFNTFVEVSRMNIDNGSPGIYCIQPLSDNTSNDLIGGEFNLPSKVGESRVKVLTFCKSFPFHVVFDRSLTIIQAGDSVLRFLTQDDDFANLNLNDCVTFMQPALEPVDFESIIDHINFPYILRTRPGTKGNQESEATEIKGQMIFIFEMDCVLFLGSPCVAKLEELTGRGLYLADIPIHDATRDVILMGEQTKAQDGLKRRMDKLKDKLEQTSKALDVERKKNVDLLESIFPADVAKKLWRDEPVESRTIESVSMLFSDLVGFTAICSTATPMMVVNMLNTLYTEFDTFCEFLDVYKMRIGLHTGSVVAGIVGRKMPRYCLFGNNVTLANKFESHSEADKINVSPTTHELLVKTKGFIFTERPIETLPEGSLSVHPGTCYFLEGYNASAAESNAVNAISR
ncbi:guanylate cyclase soluble subunit alpha-2-like [Anneissia japonica]|uniref:guanylate cyclase soluble subunit alpha-2-like n=1 Tax=Anneissia japonica TaxID=1529436 RepID=UPI001425B3FD|nr:guanylate cyclase soluble subunit alpha-2-like [Anneissia japonica]